MTDKRSQWTIHTTMKTLDTIEWLVIQAVQRIKQNNNTAKLRTSAWTKILPALAFVICALGVQPAQANTYQEVTYALEQTNLSIHQQALLTPHVCSDVEVIQKWVNTLINIVFDSIQHAKAIVVADREKALQMRKWSPPDQMAVVMLSD